MKLHCFNNIEILAYFDTNKQSTSVLNEYGKLYSYNYSLKNYVNRLCIRYGSTLDGRVEAFRELLGVSQKPCIFVSDIDKIFYIPTRSLYTNGCFLINYYTIQKVIKITEYSTTIIFVSGIEYTIQENIRVIKRQIARAEKFLEIYYGSDRKNFL